jgi:hypothetical protein
MRHTVTYARTLASRITEHLARNVRRHQENPDAGYTTETIVITALLVLAAIGALGILTTKVLDKANGMNF